MATQYPNVPNLPGVPQVPRQPGVAPSTGPTLGTPAAQGTLWQSAQTAPAWGIFDSSGNQVVTPDSVYDFSYSKPYDVPTFPIQSASNAPTGFATYNKVELPYENTVRMTKGGSESDRATFLYQVDVLAGSLALYTIATPEKRYLNANVTNVAVTRRGAGGAYFLAEVDVSFIQVMQTTAQYTTTGLPNTANAADPTAQPSVSQGNVNPQAVPAQTQQQAAGTIAFEQALAGL